MNVLIVYAHPEPKSLNGSLKDFAVTRLENAGHAVKVSDLYAMKWKASLDASDSMDGQASERFDPALDSKLAFENGRQTRDIAEEQDKLRWADAVILSHREASQSGIAAAAIAARRWIVATRVGGLAEQLEGERHAILCEPDAGSLAAAIRTLLARERDDEVGAARLDRSWPEIARSMTADLRDLAARR